jgi:hypothetical protein
LDIDKLVECCRAKLNLENATLSREYFYKSLPICIIDAVFSLGIRYSMTQKIVQSFCNKVNIECFRPYGSSYPPIENQFSVMSLVDLYNKCSFEEMADKYFISRHRTSTVSGILKSEAVGKFGKILFSFGINYFQNLPQFIGNKRFEDSIKNIKGQNSGKSLTYFYMLAGDESYIKPDRMIIRFIERCIGKSVNVMSAIALVIDAHNILIHDFPKLTLRMLDHEIWKYQRKI